MEHGHLGFKLDSNLGIVLVTIVAYTKQISKLSANEQFID